MEQERICLKCGAPLRKELMEEPEPDEEPDPEPRDSYVCDTVDCELRGGTQPQEAGSTLSYDRDGNARTLQVGPVPTGEGTLPRTIARLQMHLPRFDVSRLDGTRKEDGVDIVVICRDCGVGTEGQVVTTVSPKLAAAARKAGHATSVEPISGTLSRVADTIHDKTQSYSPIDEAFRLLVLDATIDSYWSVLAHQGRMKGIAEKTPWHGVVLTSPSVLIWLKGTRPRCNCPPVLND